MCAEFSLFLCDDCGVHCGWTNSVHGELCCYMEDRITFFFKKISAINTKTPKSEELKEGIPEKDHCWLSESHHHSQVYIVNSQYLCLWSVRS